MALDILEVEPHGEADAAVIWLHGLGASASDFEGIVPALRLPDNLKVRFVFPNAPEIPVTVNAGYVMPAWYDIFALSETREINEDQFYVSVAEIRALIDREVDRGISSERIVLAGFSQGGAVAYHTALSDTRRLAGLLALSTYVANPKSISLNSINANIPILVCRGLNDSMVTQAMMKHVLDVMETLSLSPLVKTYAMEHEVCVAEIKDISAWLQECLCL